jgi:hypothetical protein
VVTGTYGADVAPPTSKRLSEGQAQEQLHRIFSDVESWQKRWEQGALTAEIEIGSSLAGDDKRSSPYQVSHGVTHTLSAAVDHLHALKVLVEDAGTLHNSAPYTLARSAIETSSTALWMLAPKRRADRVRRRLIYAAQESKDGATMATEAGVPVPRELPEIMAAIQGVADRADVGDVQQPRLNVTQMIREADRLDYTLMNALAAWRLCSGFAHGRLWPALAILEREVFPTPEAGVNVLRLTNRLHAVLWPAWAAHDLVAGTLRLFETRAASPYRQ